MKNPLTNSNKDKKEKENEVMKHRKGKSKLLKGKWNIKMRVRRTKQLYV